jgi:hypothetical protein
MIDSSLFNLIYKRRLCRPLSRHLTRHFGQNIITLPSGIIGLDFLMVSSFLSSLPSLLIVHTLRHVEAKGFDANLRLAIRIPNITCWVFKFIEIFRSSYSFL